MESKILIINNAFVRSVIPRLLSLRPRLLGCGADWRPTRPTHRSRRRLTRWLLVGVTMAGLLPMVAACTPGPSPIIALAPGSANPAALIFLCKGDSAIRLAVYEQVEGGPVWSINGSTPALPTPAPTNTIMRVTLFTAPTGWHVTDDTMKRFTPGHNYGISGITRLFHQFILRFSMADVTGVADGKVLVPDGNSAKVTTIGAFKARAAKTCG